MAERLRTTSGPVRRIGNQSIGLLRAGRECYQRQINP